MASCSRQQFAREPGKQLTVASSSAYDVFRLSLSTTDLQPASAADAVIVVPPFAIINVLIPRSTFIGSTTMAGEPFEGNATVSSTAFVVRRSRSGIDATVASGRWTAARQIIANTAEKLAGALIALGRKQ